MKRLYHFTTVLLTLLTMSACTLMDNDLRDLPDVPGYGETVHVETDEYTCDYKFQDNTILMDERYNDYIYAIDYANHKLYMYDFTPDEYLPKVGQPLTASHTEKLEYGILNIVESVKREGPYYVISLGHATLDDVYEVFRLDGDFILEGEDEFLNDDEEENDSTAVAGSRLTRAKAVEDDESSGWQEMDLLDLLKFYSIFLTSNGVFTEKTFGKISKFASFQGQWCEKGKTLGYDENTGKVKTNGAFALYADAKGQLLIRSKNLGKLHTYIDLDGRKLDLKATAGYQFQIVPQITGKIGFHVDFVKFFKKLPPVPKPIPNPFGLPLFWKLEPSVVLDGNINGTIGLTIEKTFKVDFGAYHNVSKHSDGPFVNTESKPVTKKSNPDIEKAWDVSGDWSVDGEISLQGGIEGTIFIGDPVSVPKVGLTLSAAIGPKLKTEKSDFDRRLHFGVPVSLGGKFYFDLFKGIDPFEWDYMDAIFKLFGGDTDVYEFSPINWRFFPSIDHMSILCENPDEVGTVPKFKVSFDVEDNGLSGTDVRPLLNVNVHGIPDKIYSEPDNKKAISTSGTTHYEWNLSFPFERDRYYDAEIVWVKKILGVDVPLCKKVFPFTSTTPSLTIDSYGKIMQKKYVSSSSTTIGPNQVSYKCYYDYRFITGVVFTKEDKVQNWGFDIGKKEYPINARPLTNRYVVKWAINKSSKKQRKIKLSPWVIADGYKVYGNSLTVSLDFDEDEDEDGFKVNSYHDYYERKWGQGWYTTGYDDSSEYDSNIDMTGSSLSRQVDDPNTQVIEITIDDDDANDTVEDDI